MSIWQVAEVTTVVLDGIVVGLSVPADTIVGRGPFLGMFESIVFALVIVLVDQRPGLFGSVARSLLKPR